VIVSSKDFEPSMEYILMNDEFVFTIKQDSSARASVRAGAAFQLELHSTKRSQNYRG